MNANRKKASNKMRFLHQLDLDKSVVDKLSVHLNSLKQGSKLSILTPLVKDVDPNSVLAEWDVLFNENKAVLNDTLLSIEFAQRQKFGPRSISKPWSERKSNLLDYFKPKQSRFYFKPFKFNGSLRPIRITSALTFLKNSSSSGLPFYTKKEKVKPTLVSNFYKLLSRQDPCVLFTRTQEGNKTRDIWGFPIADTINEVMYYRPLFDYQKSLKWRSAVVSPDLVDKYVSEMLRFAKQSGYIIVSADFSRYDASISRKLINASFNYIKSLFQVEYHIQLDYIKSRFLTIDIVTPDGVISGEHGVPSGSTFTNEVDSIVQYLVALSSKVILPDYLQIQGDDGLYVIKESDFKRLTQAFTDAGLVFNQSKSYKAKDYCVYLQRLYHTDYSNDNGFIGGIYPIYRALNRLCFQERWTNFGVIGLSGEDYYSLRTLAILESCKFHPLFREFVKFIYSKDKYALKFSKQSVFKFFQLQNKGPGNGSVKFNQYGDDIRGVRSFESYKIVLELEKQRLA